MRNEIGSTTTATVPSRRDVLEIGTAEGSPRCWPRSRRPTFPTPYDWNAAPRLDTRKGFIDWMVSNRGEDIRHEWWFAATQLALAMFGMGATLRLDDFVAVFREPKAFIVGFVIQVVGIPLVALATNAVLQPSPGIAFGLILVAAMPGGAMSNAVTYFARSNVPLSIALTAVVTLSCMLTTPIVLRLLASEFVPLDFSMPVGAIALDIDSTLCRRSA